MPYARKTVIGAAAVSMAVLMGSSSAHAIQVTGGADGATLADTLFLNVPGLTVNSVNLSGFGDQFGTFTNASGTYGLPSQGIVLSTGNVNDYSDGPNTDSGNTTAFGEGDNGASAAQEALLDPITGGGFDHFDVAQLTIEFNVGPGIDSVTFFGTFGSEEFPEFTGSEFVDGFGLFVNGTNRAFVNGDPINIDHPDFIGAVNDDDFPDFPDGGEGPPFEEGGEFDLPPLAINAVEPGDPRLALVTGTELDGVLAPDVNPVLRFDVPVSEGTNVFDIIIADTSDDVLDSTIYLSSFLPTEIDLNDGGTEFTPLLPGDTDPNTGAFIFDLPDDLDLGEVFFIDPPATVGYVYEVTDAEFKTIVAPSGAVVPDSDGYTIEIAGQFFNLLPGGTLDVSAFGADTFTLTGIDEELFLDPLSPLAFPLGVALQPELGQQGFGILPTLSQTPIVVDVPPPSAVPLPAGLPLYIAAVLGFIGFRKFRSRT